MPYTTQGYMTAADMADYHDLHDTGTTDVHLDDVPDWFEDDLDDDCPVCGDPVGSHDVVTVVDASGEIVACLPDGGEWHPRAEDLSPIY